MFGASCLVQGPMVWYFGEGAQVVNPVSANYISMAFWYTILHLRHSELPFLRNWNAGQDHTGAGTSSGPPFNQSCALRQKLGLLPLRLGLGVWNIVCAQARRENSTMAWGHEDDALETVVGSILAPFGRALLILFPWLKPRAQQEPSSLSTSVIRSLFCSPLVALSGGPCCRCRGWH